MKLSTNSTPGVSKDAWYLKIVRFIEKGVGAIGMLPGSELWKRRIVPVFMGTAMVIFTLIFFRFFIPLIFESVIQWGPHSRNSVNPADTLLINKKMEEYNGKILSLERKINRQSLFPYILINTTKNEFKLYKGGELIREGICSTGSYVRLEYDGEKKWVFRTPKGMFRIKGKTKYPVWKKPDWAFVEEGKPIPSLNHPSRYEYGVLGDYSLSLGDGYLIHGTLYQRMLGMPVTHGCVRLGDDDLETVFHTLNIGDRVFIY